MYTRSKMGLMRDRDIVFKIQKVKLEDGSYMMFSRSIEHPDYPVNKECYRLNYYKSVLLKQVGENVQ